MVKVTQKWYAILRYPKMYPHTKFGIPTSMNIGDMDRTRKRDGRTDGRTVRSLYATQSSFGAIKTISWASKRENLSLGIANTCSIRAV